MVFRFKQLLENLGLTASEFADRIGVQRSSVSHVLSGRNKPGSDFLEKILTVFPDVDANWLITGKGNWKKVSAETQKVIHENNFPLEDITEHTKKKLNQEITSSSGQDMKKPAPGEPAPVEHILIVYTNNTFRILTPAN